MWGDDQWIKKCAAVLRGNLLHVRESDLPGLVLFFLARTSFNQAGVSECKPAIAKPHFVLVWLDSFQKSAEVMKVFFKRSIISENFSRGTHGRTSTETTQPAAAVLGRKNHDECCWQNE